MARRRRIEYEDFAVRIKPDGRDGFVSEVVWAPGGGSSASAPFVPPFDHDEIEPLLSHLERAIRGSGSEDGRRHLTAPPTPASRRFDPEEVGARLFRALFLDDVRAAYESAHSPGDKAGLRIRLVVDPRQEGCAEIAALPWELLYDPARGFLCHSIRFPVVRFLETLRAIEPRPIEGDLRVLVAICSPEELSSVDGATERAAVGSWGGIRGVEVHVLERATLEQVRDCLKRGNYHVFHFCGHGKLAGHGGSLVFHEGRTGAKVVDARLLSAYLGNAPGLRLAVLNACNSGRMPRRAGRDPFSGVATALVRSAIPAVIGMQYPISDVAATRFARALYKSLAAGEPIDAAVAEGRLAILLGDSTSLEWATPALHLRVRSAKLFERRPGAARRRWIAAAAGLGLAALATVAALWTGNESPPEDAKGSKPSYQRPAWLPNDPRCPAPQLLPDLELAYIPPGSLVLPSEKGDPPRYLAQERGLCVARYETDQSQWATVMGGDPPSSEPGHGGDLPAAGISLAEAQRFVSWLNERETGDPFRLPSGDEWEYAARGGQKTRFSFGDDPEDLPLYGNCRSSGPLSDHYDDDPAPVGSYDPNDFELYDMHGNVAEWVTDTLETESGELRQVRRGGSFKRIASSCEASYVSHVQPDHNDQTTGFRIVRDPVEPGD